VHTHASLAHHARMAGRRLSLSANDHWWLCLPVAHIGGFGVVVRAAHTGARLTVDAHVDDASIAAARKGGATHTSVVPTHVFRHDLRDWELVLVGGQRAAALPANAVATYGLTETGGGVVYDGVPLDDVEAFSCPLAGVAPSSRVSSGARRTGLVGRAPATHCSCRLRPSTCWIS